MQDFDIVKRSQPGESFRVKSVMGPYDIQKNVAEEHVRGSLDLDFEWNIGHIVGRSGSGKTTIARELFGDNIISGYEYTHESILDDMPKGASVEEISMALTSVGFASPPSWLKSYSVLSNGEKMRCDLARAILEKRDLFAFDEFTSVVDRNVAKIASLAMQKAIRRGGQKFIAISCHYDIQEWLMPDWVFNTDTMTFSRLDLDEQKKNRPPIELTIVETKHKEFYWNVFRKYHYLSHAFNRVARVFLTFANGELCGFAALLPFPHPTRKHVWKFHRRVVLPDYQGVGIARAMSAFIADIFKRDGTDIISTTSNRAMIASMAHDKRWICTHIGRLSAGSTTGVMQNKAVKGSTSGARITASFEYIGENDKSISRGKITRHTQRKR